jgi:hypothetical protein
MNSQSFQQYVRIFLYYAFGALATYGVTVPDNTKALVVSIVGVAANFLWTLWGTRLNGLLEQIKAKSGVEAIEVKVDPEIIQPATIVAGTSSGITAKPAS